MTSATLAARIGTGQGGGTPGAYCPPVVVTANDFATATISTAAPFSGVLDGFNLDQITNVTVSLVGNAAVQGTVTNLNTAFLQATFDLALPQPGQYNVVAQGICGNFGFQVTGANITCLVPGQNGVNWQGVVNANVGAGTIAAVAGNGNGWNRGGHFGFAPANTEASLSFTVAPPSTTVNGYFGFFGVRNTQPNNIAFGSAGRAVYVQNGNLLVYNNTAFQSNLGAPGGPGTQVRIERNLAGQTKVFRNGVDSFTFPTNDTGAWWFASSIFRNAAIEDIELCHS